MGTLQEQIAARFLAKLAESNRVDAPTMEQLRTLLKGSKRPKADDFVKIFSLLARDDVK